MAEGARRAGVRGAVARTQLTGESAADHVGEGPLRALVGREWWDWDNSERWHISVSCADRVPTWEELVTTVHELRPGVPFCMGVPPKTWWMNVHPHVLHMWETRDDGLIEEWRRNARGHTPT